jgi:hypothetical protein
MILGQERIRYLARWLGPVTVSLAMACGASPKSPRASAAARQRPAGTVAEPGTTLDSSKGVDRLIVDARALAPTLRAPFTKRFVGAVEFLPRITPRTLYHNADKTRWYSEREYRALADADRGPLMKTTIDEDTYYSTKFGSPLSYSRPFDVLAEHGVRLGPGVRLFDFGYGYVGHLRLLASLGLDVVGVDVDPLLPALYGEPSDQGRIRGPEAAGQLRLLHGLFPNDRDLVAGVGTGYDVIVSKNVLKKGYIHPDRPADPRHLIDLGVSDDVALAAFFHALKPGGHMLVYNICPAPTPPDQPFKPWSDGRSPFSRAAWEASGFRVLAFDRDDFAAVHRMADLLGWGRDPESPWDLDHDLSVLYTLVRRP